MSQEEFLLKWNDHHASFFTIVEDLCRTEQLCDVTLACGGQVFETHKLILSVCSPYFRTLLNSRPDKHPIVYLKDVNPKHLEQLLSYMYRGEINVLQDDLGPLIETARGLQIKGLADAGGDGGGGGNNSRKEQKSGSQNGLASHQHNQPKRSRTTTPTPAPKMPRIEPGSHPGLSVPPLRLPTSPHPAPIPITRVVSPPSPPSHLNIAEEEEDEDEQQPIVEVDPGDNPNIKAEQSWMMASGEDSSEYEIPSEQFEQDMQAEDEQYIQAGNDALSGQQLAMLKKEFNKKYSCEFCQKRFPTPSKLQRHQLVHSGEKPYLCFICLKGFTQRVHLNTHKKHAHPQTMLDNPPQLMLDGQPQLNIEGEDENDNIAVPEIDEEPPLAIVQT